MRPLVVSVCVLLLVIGIGAHADAQSHRQAARDFYEASRPTDTAAVVGAVAVMIVQMQPEWRNQREIVEEFALEMVTSETFTEANVRVIAEMFSEEELETLVWLFRHSAYQNYRDKGAELVRRSTLVTMNLFRDSLPELERRIEADRRR